MVETENTIEEYVKAISMKADCGRLSVGAALIHDGKLIGSGYNRKPIMMEGETCNNSGHLIRQVNGRDSCYRTTHAEVAAVHDAIRMGGYGRLKESTLYVTHTPCPDCIKFLLEFGIRKVYYFNEYGDVDEELSKHIDISQFVWG